MTFDLVQLPLDCTPEYALQVLDTNKTILNAAMWRGICNNDHEYIQEACRLMEETLYMEKMTISAKEGRLIVEDVISIH